MQSRFRSHTPAAILLSLFCINLWSILPPATAARSSQSPQQDEAIKLHSDLVLVNVTITDAAGLYIHGLGQKDFTVIEDGQQQAIDSFSTEESPFAAAILVDMSGSMERKFGLVRGSAASFLEQIRENDQVAVYGFNDQVRLFQEFSDVRLISDYIWDAKAENTTRLYDCMKEAIAALAGRTEKRRAILLISDGCDSSSRKSSFDSVMKEALAAGVTVYTVDLIGNNELAGGTSEAAALRRGRKEMQQFAEQTGGRYIHAPHGDRLEEAFTQVVDELRNQYTLAYYSTNPKRDGRWRKVSIIALPKGAQVRSRKGYFAPKEKP
jgi:VWFA-related protein